MTRFEQLEGVYASSSEDPKEEELKYLEIERVQYLKGLVLLTFRNIRSFPQAEALKNFGLWIRDEEALPLEEDEFYIRDFLGARCLDRDGKEVGSISDILETRANFVLEVKGRDGKVTLVPCVKDFVLSMDPETKTVTLVMPEVVE